MKSKSNLQKTFITTFFIAIVVPVVVIGSVTMILSFRQVKSAIETKNKIVSILIAQSVSDFIQKSFHHISSSSGIINTNLSRNKSNDEILKQLVIAHPEFISGFIVNMEGLVLESYPNKFEKGNDVSSYSYFKVPKETKRPFWSESFISTQNQLPMASVTVPFEGGMIVVFYDLSYLSKNSLRTNLSTGNVVALVDQHGKYVAHPNMDYVLRSEYDPFFNLYKKEGRHDIVHSHRVYEGKEKIVYFNVISQIGWGVLVYQDLWVVYKPLVANLIVFFLVVLLLGILGMYISQRKLRNILRSFTDLFEGVRIISLGNYDYRIPEQKYEEFDDLAKAVNAMSEQINTREKQLRHSQKMEAVGRLAGGIAHDFNNILGAIVGNTELASFDPMVKVSIRKYLDEILFACDRATILVKQLLTFSRREEPQKSFININAVVEQFQPMISRIIRGDIEVDMKLGENMQLIYADEVQIEQILMNLCVNAQDAMEGKGRIIIATEFVSSFCGDRVYGGSVLDVPYVKLSVRDTGQGISENDREHIFEPFFTTKEVGKGTGLGLATVFAIVERHKGFITVDSEMGEGTCFCVYFPIREKGDSPKDEIINGDTVQLLGYGNGKTILFAEDDQQIRELIENILLKYGYKLLLAQDGEHAEQLFHANAEIISLCLLDVLMPKQTGWEVVNSIREVKPNMPVILLTGYTQDVLDKMEFKNLEVTLLSKPIKPSELLKIVYNLINSNKA